MKLENVLPVVGAGAVLWLVLSPKSSSSAPAPAPDAPATPARRGTQGLGDATSDLINAGEDAAAVVLAKAIQIAAKDPDTQQILTNVAGDAAGKLATSIVVALIISTLITIWAVKRKSA